jgi:hypothetical protein
MAVPLAAAKFDEWEAWVAELNGPRKAGFEDMNSRHGLTEHRAYLQSMPDGNYTVLVVAEGSGADNFVPSILQSDHEFDRWFGQSVIELHDMDLSAPPPPMAKRRL